MLKTLWGRKQWHLQGGLRMPLLVPALLIVVSHVLGSYAWREARKVNARWLEAESSYTHRSPRAPAADIMLRRFAETIADHSCEIARPTVCEKTEAPTSPALSAVNLADLPPASRKLLDENGYSSADHLLVALLFNGQEAAVPGTLAALMRTGKLTSLAVHQFLYEWFLGPAVTYYREGRAEDAAALFLAFVDNEVAAFNSGMRLAGVDDVDVTDLPALFDAFCRGPAKESGWLEPCAVPFLHALSAVERGVRPWDPMGAGIPNFLSSYRAVAGSSAELVSYLDMEKLVGVLNSPIESWNPDVLPAEARYLGHYALGRHFASTPADSAACAQRRVAALAEFRRGNTPATPPYFLRALQQAEDELARRTECGTLRVDYD